MTAAADDPARACGAALPVRAPRRVQDACLGESAGVIARQGSERIIADQCAVIGAMRAGDHISGLGLLGGGTYRTKIWSSENKAGHGLLFHGGWEEFGRSHLARTALNLAQPG